MTIGKRALLVLAVCATGALIGPATASAAPGPTTGIWYSTWYTNKGHYIWISGHGYGSNQQFLEDVNGDGRDDAVAFFNDHDAANRAGRWYVSLSNGNGFGGYELYTYGHGHTSSDQFLTDVTGDGRADAVVYFQSNGCWYVAPSTGSGFGGYTQWICGHGIGSTTRMMRDVNGDGRSDAVVFFDFADAEGRRGRWYVAPSNGTSFPTYGLWTYGHGYTSNQQVLADGTGDGRADAIVYFQATRCWYLARSTGGGFLGYEPWACDHSKTEGATSRTFGDVTGDGKEDLVTYYSDYPTAKSPQWFLSQSTGNGFANPELWKVQHGGARGLLGDVDGRSPARADAVTYTALGRRSTGVVVAGEWRFLPAEGKASTQEATGAWSPAMWNRWEHYSVKYKPRVGSGYRQYDSTDPDVIDEHLDLIQDAGIDYLLLDETNLLGIDGGTVMAGADAVCARIAARVNAGQPTPKVAFGVNGSSPATFESEAGQVWQRYASSTRCGELGGNGVSKGYMTWPDTAGVERPILVFWGDQDQRYAWFHCGGCQSASNHFTLRFAQGDVDSNVIWPNDVGSFYGWRYSAGSLDSPETMVAMPGWNKPVGCPMGVPTGPQQCDRVARNDGAWYSNQNWARIRSRKPRMAVINSFNEYMEQTAVAPTDTSQIDPNDGNREERWSSPEQYWSITRTNNLARKQGN